MYAKYHFLVYRCVKLMRVLIFTIIFHLKRWRTSVNYLVIRPQPSVVCKWESISGISWRCDMHIQFSEVCGLVWSQQSYPLQVLQGLIVNAFLFTLVPKMNHTITSLQGNDHNRSRIAIFRESQIAICSDDKRRTDSQKTKGRSFFRLFISLSNGRLRRQWRYQWVVEPFVCFRQSTARFVSDINLLNCPFCISLVPKRVHYAIDS